MNKSAIFTIAAILIIVGGFTVYISQMRAPVEPATNASNQQVAGPKVDTTGWKDMEDEQRMFSMKFPPAYTYLKSEMDKFGTGAFCRDTSNWQAVLKDKTGKTKLTDCLAYTIVSNAAELDKFSEKFYNDKVKEAGGKNFTSEKDVVLLGENAWLRQAYKEETTGKQFYTYISTNDKDQVVVFDLSSIDKSEHEKIHDMLSTLKFVFGSLN